MLEVFSEGWHQPVSPSGVPSKARWLPASCIQACRAQPGCSQSDDGTPSQIQAPTRPQSAARRLLILPYSFALHVLCAYTVEASTHIVLVQEFRFTRPRVYYTCCTCQDAWIHTHWKLAHQIQWAWIVLYQSVQYLSVHRSKILWIETQKCFYLWLTKAANNNTVILL